MDFPRDSSIDWNIDNTWVAGEGIISVEAQGLGASEKKRKKKTI